MSGAVEVAVPTALDPATVAELAGAIDDAVRGPARTVVLRGGADVFCRGLDASAVGDAGTRRTAIRTFVGVLLSVRRADRPFVALVEGPAYGGGVGLAAACDVVLATRGATFGLPEVLLGLAPLTIRPVLRERMSSQAVRRMALSAFGHTADRCAAFGLVDEVVEEGDVDAVLARWLRILGRGGRRGVGALKRHSAEEEGLEAALLRGADALETLLDDPDAHAPVAALDHVLDGGELPWGSP